MSIQYMDVDSLVNEFRQISSDHGADISDTPVQTDLPAYDAKVNTLRYSDYVGSSSILSVATEYISPCEELTKAIIMNTLHRNN